MALAVFGIALCALIMLIGDSLKSASKANLRISALELAREKIEAAVLDTLGQPVHRGAERIVWEGKTEGGLGWMVEAIPWKRGQPVDNTGEEKTGWFFFKVSVDGVHLSTVGPEPERDAKKE